MNAVMPDTKSVIPIIIYSCHFTIYSIS
jgi:hypothetical protein